MVHDRHRATPLGEQHHAFAHRTIGSRVGRSFVSITRRRAAASSGPALPPG